MGTSSVFTANMLDWIGTYSLVIAAYKSPTNFHYKKVGSMVVVGQL